MIVKQIMLSREKEAKRAQKKEISSNLSQVIKTIEKLELAIEKLELVKSS